MNTKRKFLPNDDERNQGQQQFRSTEGEFRLLPRYSELVARARRGDREALGALRNEHAANVRELVSERVPDALFRDDACQDVWLAVIQEIASYEGGSDRFKEWLLGIAERTCRQLTAEWENERLRVPLDSVASRLVAPSSSMDPVDAAEFMSAVERALEKVPAREREAFRLAHFDELTPDEVAAEMGVSEARAEALVKRCAARLRVLLAKFDPRNQ